MTSEPLCTYETRATDGECEACGRAKNNTCHREGRYTELHHVWLGKLMRCGHPAIKHPLKYRRLGCDQCYGEAKPGTFWIHDFQTEPVKEQASD